jgi:hypothetical protein
MAPPIDTSADTLSCFDLPAGVRPVAGHHIGSHRIRNLPARIYHAQLERQSCSMLKPMLLSPAHYQQQFFESRTSSAAMDWGSLVHLLVLEPSQLPFHYAVVANNKYSPAQKRELAALHPGLQIITEVALHRARLAADRVLHRQVRGRAFYRYVEEGEAEVTLLYEDPVTGLRCRTRIDLWHPEALFDLKTTRHAAVAEFGRSCMNLHYDLQAYMYCLADAQFDGRDAARPFVFLALQSSDPHPVHVLTAGQTFMANGEAKYARAISLLAACMQTDHWPDNSCDEVLEIEPWNAYDSYGSKTLAEEAINP